MWSSIVPALSLLATSPAPAVAPDAAQPTDVSAALQAEIDSFASVDREQVVERLERLLAQVGDPNRVATEPGLFDRALRAWVILAGLRLVGEDVDGANEAMDEALRLAGGQPLPVNEYGPKLTELFEQRRTVLDAAGTATIEIECEVECEVVLNLQQLSERSTTLLLGSYDVWVKAEGVETWERHSVELTTPDSIVTVECTLLSPAAPPPPSSPPPPKRLLPRGAEIAGIGIGVGLVIAGAVVLSFNGKCTLTRKLPTPLESPQTCGEIYDAVPAGGSLLGVGTGLLVISGVLLSVDEVRVGRERGRQVMIGVSGKF